MSTLKTLYPASPVAITISLASLATSSTFVAGRESDAISNRTNLDTDHLLSGKIRVGTTPTATTYIQIYVVAPLLEASGTVTWPDVFDGTDSAETATSAGIRDGCAVLAKSILVDATTSDRDYYFDGVSVAALFGSMPTDYVVFVTHNTGVNLNSTGGNHTLYYQRVQQQIV